MKEDEKRKVMHKHGSVPGLDLNYGSSGPYQTWEIVSLLHPTIRYYAVFGTKTVKCKEHPDEIKLAEPLTKENALTFDALDVIIGHYRQVNTVEEPTGLSVTIQ